MLIPALSGEAANDIESEISGSIFDPAMFCRTGHCASGCNGLK